MGKTSQAETETPSRWERLSRGPQSKLSRANCNCVIQLEGQNLLGVVRERKLESSPGVSL